jgi:hypothetical protein
LTCGFVAVIVASPWLMRSVVGRSAEWQELSDVGQAYGGVSAILAGLAFCGIAGSLILQWRQTRLTHVMTVSEQHFALAKMGIDDPDLMFPLVSGTPTAEVRRWVLLNLWVAHWRMRWETGELSSAGLRTCFQLLFAEDAARTWWRTLGMGGWGVDHDADRRSRAFEAIADTAYRKAVDAALEKSAISPISTRDGAAADTAARNTPRDQPRT